MQRGQLGSRLCVHEGAGVGGVRRRQLCERDGGDGRQCCVCPRCGAHVSGDKVWRSNRVVMLLLWEEHRAIL